MSDILIGGDVMYNLTFDETNNSVIINIRVPESIYKIIDDDMDRILYFNSCSYLTNTHMNRYGRIYLNQIYESMYLKWDPSWPNEVILKKSDNHLFKFGLEHDANTDSYFIIIRYKEVTKDEAEKIKSQNIIKQRS